MSQYPFVCNAQIESAEIQFDRGVFLSAWVMLKYNGGGQGFGGFVLGGSPFDEAVKCAEHHNQKNLCADFIGAVLAVAGVERWSDLAGKIVRVGKTDEWGEIIALGHAVKDRWYNPKLRFEALTKGRAND